MRTLSVLLKLVLIMLITGTFGCDDTTRRPSPLQAGEQAGEQSGESVGTQAGEQAGAPAGEQAGTPAGEQAGTLTGEQAGAPLT